jgi:hypothetical protein
MPRTPPTPETLFWDIIDELRLRDARLEEGTVIGGRCARVAGEFLGLVDFKGSGMVIKLPRNRVAELINEGIGQPFAPAGKMFREWIAIPKLDPTPLDHTPPRSNQLRCAARRPHDRASIRWIATPTGQP